MPRADDARVEAFGTPANCIDLLTSAVSRMA
jgi:hypothetical protein